MAATAAGSNEPPRLGDRERSRARARRDGAEESGALLVGTGVAYRGHELRDRREERPRCDHPADLLGEDARLDHSESDATVGFGHREAGPAQFAESGPERVGPLVVVDDAPGERDRALACASTARIESRSSS